MTSGGSVEVVISVVIVLMYTVYVRLYVFLFIPVLYGSLLYVMVFFGFSMVRARRAGIFCQWPRRMMMVVS